MQIAMFWPMLAQVALTMIVAGRMYAHRVAELRSRKLHPQALSTRAGAAGVLVNTAAADNYQNQFETPVLFYVACLTFGMTDTVGVAAIVLAWLFVLLRAVHAYIHLTHNRVLHRFAAFLTGGVVLLCFWLLLVYSVLTGVD